MKYLLAIFILIINLTIFSPIGAQTPCTGIGHETLQGFANCLARTNTAGSYMPAHEAEVQNALSRHIAPMYADPLADELSVVSAIMMSEGRIHGIYNPYFSYPYSRWLINWPYMR